MSATRNEKNEKINITNIRKMSKKEIGKLNFTKERQLNILLKAIKDDNISDNRRKFLIETLLVNLEENLSNGKISFIERYDTVKNKMILLPTTMKTIEGISEQIISPGLAEIDKANAYGSDYNEIYSVLTSGDMNLRFIKANKKATDRILKNQGHFFKYINKTTIDLTDLQIFNSKMEDKDLQKHLKNHCLVYALQKSGINNDLIVSSLINKSTINSDKFLLRRIPELDENIKVILTEYRDRLVKTTYGSSKAKKVVELFLYKNHFMINKEFPITSYAINNYNEVCDLKDWNKIYRKTRYYCRSDDKFIKTEKLIPLMFKNNLFVEDEEYNTKAKIILNSRETICFKNINLKHVEKEPVEFKLKENDKKTFVFYGDCETITAEDGTLNLLSLAVASEGSLDYFEAVDKRFNPRLIKRMREAILKRNPVSDKAKNFEIQKDIVNRIFEQMYRYVNTFEKLNKETLKDIKVLLYFHNVKFDFNMISPLLTSDNFVQKSVCKKDGALYSYGLTYKGLSFVFKDTFKFMPMSLKSICEKFKVEQKLEIINYDYFDYSNAPFKDLIIGDKNYIEYIKNFSDKQVKELNKYSVNNKIDLLRLMSIYLNVDVISLAKAFGKYRKNILNETDLDVHNYLTISSLAYDYALKEDCFENCRKVSASVREFCQQALVGGRVATKLNKPWHIKNKLEDYDVNSLYPSAMVRMSEEGFGIPCGEITHIKNFNEVIKSNKYYICEIEIKSIKRRMGIPFISFKKEDGKRCWSDDINDYLNKTITVDKFSLEDFIEFHKIDFKFIRGIQWSNWNPKIGFLMKELFDKRNKFKKSNSCLAECLKLIMNSIYGKTALKPSNSVYKIYNKNSEKDAVNIASRYYDKLISLETVGNGLQLNIFKDEYKHSNLNYVGVAILSFSKRIMNEVQSLAHDLNVNIYYQDTDSLAVETSGIELLKSEYKKKYSKILDGFNLTQFHSDFNSEIIKNPVSIESYFLGPKFYVHKLGNRNNETDIFDYHIRCKGVGSKAILNHIGKNKTTVMKLYDELYAGSEFDIDLVFVNKPKFEVKFEHIKKLTTYTRNIKCLI